LAERKWETHQIDTLTAYCAAWSRWRAAEEWLATPAEDGSDRYIVSVYDDKGVCKSHGLSPQVALSERSNKEMTRLAKILRLNFRPPAAKPANQPVAPVESGENWDTDLF
jgi:phage terminase small subunit